MGDGSKLREIKRLRALVATMSEVSRRITESWDLDTVLQEVIDGARSLTGARRPHLGRERWRASRHPDHLHDSPNRPAVISKNFRIRNSAATTDFPACSPPATRMNLLSDASISACSAVGDTPVCSIILSSHFVNVAPSRRKEKRPPQPCGTGALGAFIYVIPVYVRIASASKARCRAGVRKPAACYDPPRRAAYLDAS